MSKVRVAKRSGSVIPLPEEATARRTARTAEAGPKDTLAEVVAQRTYFPPAELLPFLSRPGSFTGPGKAAAAGLDALVLSNRIGEPSIFRRRHESHGDLLPAVLRESLRRKDRSRIMGRFSRALDRELIGERKAAAEEQSAKAAQMA